MGQVVATPTTPPKKADTGKVKKMIEIEQAGKEHGATKPRHMARRRSVRAKEKTWQLIFCWWSASFHLWGQRGYFSKLPTFSYQLESLTGKLIWLFKTSMYPTFTCAMAYPHSGRWYLVNVLRDLDRLKQHQSGGCRVEPCCSRPSTTNHPPAFQIGVLLPLLCAPVITTHTPTPTPPLSGFWKGGKHDGCCLTNTPRPVLWLLMRTGTSSFLSNTDQQEARDGLPAML